MDRNQPITTYIRDLLNPLKKHVFPRGGRDEFWGQETVFSQLTKRTPFSWRPADNCSIFFSWSKYFRGEKGTSKGNHSKVEKNNIMPTSSPGRYSLACLFVFLAYLIILSFGIEIAKLKLHTLQQWTTKTCAGLSIEFYIMYFAGQGKKLLGKLSNVSELSIFKTALKIWDHIWTVCK